MHDSNFVKHAHYFLCCCLLTLICSNAVSQEPVTFEDAKSNLLQAILQHTTWPDDSESEQFIIGLYGRDTELSRTLRRAVSDITIRDKTIAVATYRSLDEAAAAHVLVVSRTRNPDLTEIVTALENSQTLVVTDGSEDDKNIMINFTYPARMRLAFEVNRSNIVYAGLTLSKDILLFGGTELDAAVIYKETEAELDRAKAVALEQEKQLAAQKRTIDQQQIEVAANQAELEKLEDSLANIQTTLKASEEALALNALDLMKNQNVLAEKEKFIDRYSKRINSNLERLQGQQDEISAKESLIDEQNEVLARQVSTIEFQKYVLWAAAAVVLLVLFLIATIFRSYRGKHRINLQLQGKTKELEVANKQLQEVTEAKSRFLSTMSHEIRTPMNGVIGMAELLEDTKLNTQQREYLSLIITSADTLLSLINDILDFSKIEADRLELERIPFNLRDILGDTLQSMALRASEKGLELTFHIPPDVPDRLLGDPIRLRQVIVNLVGNAIKFTETGEVDLDLQLLHITDGSARIRFEVLDTGMGITKAQQRKIFEAFGQADTSTTRQFGGSGLGLAIASQLVEIMGGNMAVNSTPGRGSSFSFSADFDISDESASQPLHPDSLNNLRALVVDDNSTNRMILEELLQSWGMQVHLADSAASALTHIDQMSGEEQSFAIALLDVMMPHMDGFDLVEQLRQREQLVSMRILMLTSAGRTEQEALREKLDISRIMLKPVKHSDLLGAITDALGVTCREDVVPVKERPPEDLLPRLVLLVEDNLVNQKVAKDLLTRRGHRVMVAQNGAKALEQVKNKSFDIILMDIHMPVMDGLTATRLIREQERDKTTSVPIVAMTAGATMEDREQCFEAGMNRFVTKPFRAQELYHVVEKAEALHITSDEPTIAAAEDTESNLDWASALHKLDGDEVFLLELADMFCDQYPAVMSALEQALKEGKAADVQLSAHSLKGSANIVGAQATTAAARRLEQLARRGQLEQCSEALDSLRACIARLEPELHTVMGQIRNQNER